MRLVPVRPLLTALWSGAAGHRIGRDVLGSECSSDRRSCGCPSSHVPEGDLPDAATIVNQRQVIAARIAQVLSRLPARARPRSTAVSNGSLSSLSNVTPEERAALALDPTSNASSTTSCSSRCSPTARRSSKPIRHGTLDTTAAGTVVAVLDTGVDKTHPFLAGKVVEEACLLEDRARPEPDALPERARSADRSRRGRPLHADQLLPWHARRGHRGGQ